MKLKIVSDLHLSEYRYNNYYESEFGYLLKDPADVFIIAGDLLELNNRVYWLEDIIDKVLSKYAYCLYSNGNHEAYGSSIKDVTYLIKKLEAQYPNFHYLDNSSVVIEGKKFSGTTLWFKDKPDNILYENQLSDFAHIKEFKDSVYLKHESSIKFLEQNLNADVLITHHMPSYQFVSTEYKGSQLNRFFVTELSHLFAELKAKYWIFGHTHQAHHTKVVNTTFICNPRGYPTEYDKNGFNPNLVLEI